MAKIKIDIKTIEGTVLFSYESEANTKKKTLEQAVLTGAYLTGADLFAKHALELIDMVLEKPKPTPKPKRGRI